MEKGEGKNNKDRSVLGKCVCMCEGEGGETWNRVRAAKFFVYVLNYPTYVD